MYIELLLKGVILKDDEAVNCYAPLQQNLSI